MLINISSHIHFLKSENRINLGYLLKKFMVGFNMLDKVTKWSVLAYAIVLMALGLIGYLMANSLPSLIMGSGIGFLLLLCAILMFLGKRIGLILATILTLLLAGFFAFRYSLTKALFPALLSVLSGAMLIFLLFHLARWKKR